MFVGMDANTRHKDVCFPGHNYASFYDVTTMEPIIKTIFKNYNIDIRTRARVVEVSKYGKLLKAVILEDGSAIRGDVFVDATGTEGPLENFLKHGNGCAMCKCAVRPLVQE